MTPTTSTDSTTAILSDSLSGKVAVITGAARGIGHQIARTYAAHGATIVVSDIDESAAIAAAQTLPGAIALRCDVRHEHSVAELFDQALNRYSKVDIAVANAGIARLHRCWTCRSTRGGRRCPSTSTGSSSPCSTPPGR